MATVNIENGVVTMTIDELNEYISEKMADTATETATAKPVKKAAKPKGSRKAAEHKASKKPVYVADVLDKRNVKAMVTRATERMDRAGYPVKPYKRGTWVWLEPVDRSKGRTDGFEAAVRALPKGWKYSPKRGQAYRIFG